MPRDATKADIFGQTSIYPRLEEIPTLLLSAASSLIPLHLTSSSVPMLVILITFIPKLDNLGC
jgi:hypothetical protein